VGRIVLLTGGPAAAPTDNAALLARAFADAGWTVSSACIDTLRLDANRVLVRDAGGVDLDLGEATLLWLLGFGRRETYLDKMQLLGALAAWVPCVNGIEAILQLHGKYALAVQPLPFPHPDTSAYSEPEALVAHARRRGGRWVLKPPGGSFGQDVHVVDAEDPALPTLAERATAGGRYVLLQRYLPEVRNGEHRVLVAGGRLIGAYRREPRPGPSNLAAGGVARPADADPARDALALAVAHWLLERGIRFAGLDIAGTTLLEVNVVNPGGLATLAGLGEGDRSGDVVSAVLQSLSFATGPLALPA
jgi:glutathione synthase